MKKQHFSYAAVQSDKALSLVANARLQLWAPLIDGLVDDALL